MADNMTVLVVEDDQSLMLGLEENLKYEGYNVLTASDGTSGYEAARQHKPNLILLDVMMPGMTGYDVCRKLREENYFMPIIMLTARQDEFDKVLGFEMGADDYVTKPFSLKELLARIKATLRRENSRQPQAMSQHYEFGECRLDMDSRILVKGNDEIGLTRTEFNLLAYFLKNDGRVLTRDVLMTDVWGTDYYGTQRSLDSFVANLRSKIEPDPKHPSYIHTVHGVGYEFTIESTEAV